MNSSIYLPHKYERIGWSLILVHGIILLILAILDVSGMLPEAYYDAGYFIRVLFRYSLMIGLVFIICSKEKYEDELIMQIRLKAFQQGLFITVALSLFMFILTFLVRYPLVYESAEGINATLIFIAVIYKFKLYKFKKEND